MEMDKKGRVTLPKRFRDELGLEGKVLIVNAGDHLKVIAVPKDPIGALRGAFNTKKSFMDLRKQADAEAKKAIARRT